MSSLEEQEGNGGNDGNENGEENDGNGEEEFELIEQNQSIGLMIKWWIKKRLRVVDEIQDLRNGVIPHLPKVDHMKQQQQIIYQYMYLALPEEQQKKIRECIKFIAENAHLPSNNPDLVRSKATLTRLINKIERLFKNLLQDIYQVEVDSVEKIDLTQMILPPKKNTNTLNDLMNTLTLETPVSNNVTTPITPAEILMALTQRIDFSSESSFVPTLNSSSSSASEILNSSSSSSAPILNLGRMSLTSFTSAFSLAGDDAIFCSICWDTFNSKGDDFVVCCCCVKPIHIMCRFDLATRNKHQCPSCRQLFEEDGGKHFCSTYEIEFAEPGVRTRRTKTSSSETVAVPIPSVVATPMRTRSSIDPTSANERRMYTSTRSQLIFMLQNKRFPLELLQECLEKMLPFEDTTYTVR